MDDGHVGAPWVEGSQTVRFDESGRYGQSFQGPEGAVESFDMSDLQHASPGFRQFDQPVGFFNGRGDRFFHEGVQTLGQRV